MTATSPRTLTAESIYPDVPRLVALLLIVVLIVGTIFLRPRKRRPITADPPIFTTPSQP